MSDSALDQKILSIHDLMLASYGRQHWWPADTPFEMMVGAVLTQATSWTNVELAIGRLKEADALSPAAIRGMEPDKLASLIYSSGFYNAKAQRLKALVEYLGDTYEDDIAAMRLEDGATLRRELLSVRGIGEETADAILLYALGKPTFVIDAYTRRLFKRLGIVPKSEGYSACQRIFSDNLPCDAELFGEYHALIVEHCKVACRTKPVCEGCCLLSVCPTGWTQTEATRCP
ncbi:MAG: endonuclease [Dehalococcoidia bacterium]|nr:endonuclease [Dehalococcoidia bacterium]